MAQHFKVHELLSRDELDQLENFAREPGRTVDECHEWLQAEGFAISRNAVWRWKQSFDEQRMAQRLSRSSELAASINGAINRDGIEAVAKGASKQLLQVVFEQASMLEAEGKIDPLDVQRWSRSLKTLIATERDVVKLQKEMAEKFDREAGKLVAQRREITQEDIERARKAIFGI